MVKLACVRFAQQQILNAKLYLKYSRIVITRSDFLWVANHAPANIVVKRNTLYVPEASDWGGLSDRSFRVVKNYFVILLQFQCVSITIH